MSVISIFIAGVGGQGIILTGDLIAEAALLSGYDVKKSEVHGMAQRGGAVVSAVRFGKKVFSPLICENEADFLLSFEMLEALRNLNYLKKEGKIISSTQRIIPVTVSSGGQIYPENIELEIKKYFPDAKFIDAVELAKKAGHIRSANIVLLGALANFLPIEKDAFIKAIQQHVHPKTVEINLKAFELGLESLVPQTSSLPK